MNTIKTLIYLEEQLCDSDVKAEYITPAIIAKLHCFRKSEAQISIPTMGMLLAITSLEPLSEIQDEDITPQFLKVLHALCYSKQIPITKDIIFQLLERTKMREMINNGKLDELKMFIAGKKELLLGAYENNYTPLHLAVMQGQLKIAGCLIAENVDINAKDTCDQTALDLALHKGFDLVALMLLEAGANVSPAVKFTTHPIHLVAQRGLLSQVKKLISQDPTLIKAVDNNAHTPLYLASLNEHQETANFLNSQDNNSSLPYMSMFKLNAGAKSRKAKRNRTVCETSIC